MDSLRMLFGRLDDAGIQLKASKCIFASDKVEFLGFELSGDGIRPQSKLTDAIKHFQPPWIKKRRDVFLE